MDIKDFVVEVRHGQRGSLEVHVVSSPASGETSGPFVLSPEMEEMLARQSGLRGIISNSRASQRDLDGSNPGTEPCGSAEVVGTALFRSLFPPAVRSLFDQSYGALKDGQSGLRIKLRFDLQDPELARLHALPWELLCQPETKRFLCLDRRLPVVRYLEVPTGVAAMAVPSPLRILVVMANPSGLPQLDVEKERRLLDAAWSNHQGIESEVLEDPDPSRLHARLAQGPWHVLHFMGHGAFDATAGAGVLYFVGPQRNPLPLSGVALARLLGNFLPELRLVVLNACNTALTTAPSGLDPFSGVAAALMEGGLPAVLAMQAPIRDQAAISFSSVFYRHLAAGDPVDVAAAHGRLEIYLSDQGSAEWATPVLFMRVPDGRLFAPLIAVEAGSLLRPYLDWMIERHSFLELRGLRHHSRLHLPLEKVFVALKGDRTHPFERAQARLALERELEAVLESGQFSVEDIQAARWYLVASSSSVMPSLETRDRPFVLPGEPAETLTLGEAYRQHRRLVILGDPGSGKTTLARWLALTMARALRDDPQRPVAVPLHQIDPEAEEGGEDDFLLGRPKFPVLVRIAEYADDRMAHKAQRKVPRTLTEFLGHHTWLTLAPTLGGGRMEPEALSGLILEYLEKKEALIILDGLDEVPASIERDEILEEVHAFVRRWIGGGDRLLLSREDGQVIGRIMTGESEAWRGNRLIVTSRIAGYHASPLEVDFPHLTIEAMGDIAVDRFCDVWMQAVYEIERGPGESDDANDAIRAQAQAEADALKKEIHSPRRQRIRALASNPLLAGVLASVFHNEQAHLPEQRVRLYEAAIRNLTDVWQRRMQTGEAGLDEQEVLDLMAPIAAYIHQHEPTGLLGEKQLAELATRELALSRGDDPKKPSPEIRKAVRSFLRVLREDVGLLAARAEGVYGFLHLTFQEYLAARHLVQDLQTAGPKLMDKIDDPRWREPLLMALGYVSLQWPGALPDLLRDLLCHEGELHDLLPRGALLITAALPEMAPLPDDLVRDLSARLLRAYADREGLARFAELRGVLERAFDRLRGGGYEKPLEEVLRSALSGERSAGTSLAPAAAALVERLEWYSPRLVQALMDALPYDTPAWDWPVDRALRKAVTPPAPEVPVTPRAPKEDPLLPQSRRELEQARNEERRRELQKRIARLEERHAKAVRDFEQRKQEFDQQLQAYKTLELPLRCRIPTASLPFRRALEGDPELVRRIVQSPAWLRLVLALYGGMRDYETPASILEYEQIAAYLQLSDSERTPFVSFYQERWGREDAIYDMAVYLDERAGRMNQVWKKSPRFAAANIYQDSRLTRLLLDTLEADQSVETLIPRLWRIWRTGEDATAQAEAIVALLALGEEVSSALREAAADPALREAANAASRKLSRLSRTLDDPVTRASYHVIPGLKVLAEKLEPRRWSAAVAAVIATVMFHGARSIDSPQLLSAAPDDEQLSYLLAEFLAWRILGTTDDAVVHASAMAEALCQSCWLPELLISAFGRVSESRYLKRRTYQYGWPVETLVPRTVDRNDIPIAVLENLERIHPDLGFVRGAFLQHLMPVLERNPGLLPEMLALNLGSRGDNEARESTHRALYPPLVGHPDPWSEIERMANATNSPYHRARALLRLSEYRPQKRESLVAGARSAIQRIEDPRQKGEVLEKLLQLSPTGERAALVKELLRLVPKILPLADQVRALGRLTRYVPPQQGEALLKEALAKVKRLRDEALRAETLLALMPLLAAYPVLLIRAQAQAGELTSRWCRSLALDLHGAQLLPLHTVLAGASTDSPDLWAPLVLSALIRDGEQNAEPSPEQLWLRLGMNPGPRELAALHKHALAEGLVLTRAAAQVLDQLLGVRGNGPVIESILPLLERQEIETFPIVEQWLDHPNARVAHYAALCFSEAQGISPRTVGAILELLQDEQDLWRHRAARLIHHPSIVPDEPTRTLSGLGRETVEFLFQEAIRRDLDAPQVSLMIHWLYHDLVYDSAEIFEQWLQSVDYGGERAAVAQTLLRGIEAMTEPVWEVFLAGLIQERPAVQVSLLTSLCRLHHKERVKKEQVLKRISDEQWAGFLAAVPQISLEPLSDYRISTAGPLELVQAARQALEQRESLPDDQIAALAGDLLQQLFSTSFADILRLDPEAMKREMKAVAVLLLYSPTPDVHRVIREAAVQLKEDQDLFRFVLLWLTKLLQDSVQDSRFDPKRYYLLLLMAAAELSPATFSNLADPEELEPLLTLAAKCHNSYPGRAAAVTLLGFLRRVTTEGVQALHAAMKDVIYVQQSALDAVLRFRRLDGEILPLLFEGLYHPSAMTGYATAQLLAALGRSDRTYPEQRRQILRALADAVRDPRSERVVHFGYVNARVPALPRLNHSYYRAMMQVAAIE